MAERPLGEDPPARPHTEQHMPQLYNLTVTLHLLAAIVWLGGMLFFAMVAPILRGIADDGTRQGLFDALGRRFRLVGWACIALLLVTGVGQLQLRGWLNREVMGSADFWSTAPGRALAWKLWFVAAMLSVQALHDFWLGPRAGRVPPGSSEARTLRRRAAWLARANALLGLGLVYVAVRLVRGG